MGEVYMPPFSGFLQRFCDLLNLLNQPLVVTQRGADA
jgi:hypothetical protein